MRRVEAEKFAYLRPNKELYKADTITTRFSYRCDWEPAFGSFSPERHRIQAGEKTRILNFRDCSTLWTGKERLLICGFHYRKETGKEP